MKKYRTERWREGEIEAVECDRETDKSVWINGRKRAKRSGHGCYFDTFDEAKTCLVEEAEEAVRAERRSLDRKIAYFERVKRLKESL